MQLWQRTQAARTPSMPLPEEVKTALGRLTDDKLRRAVERAASAHLGRDDEV